MLKDAPADRWINPLLPAFALMIIGGLSYSAVEYSQDGPLQANISSQEIQAGMKCNPRQEDVVQKCDALEAVGKQIWTCNADREWEKWGGCIVMTNY